MIFCQRFVAIRTYIGSSRVVGRGGEGYAKSTATRRYYIKRFGKSRERDKFILFNKTFRIFVSSVRA